MNKVAHYNGFVGRCQQYGLTKQAADMLYKQAGAADKAAKEGFGALLKRVLWTNPVNYTHGKINTLGDKMFTEGILRTSNGKNEGLLTKTLLSLGEKARNMTPEEANAIAKFGVTAAAAPAVIYGAHKAGDMIRNKARNDIADYLNDIEERRTARRAYV